MNLDSCLSVDSRQELPQGLSRQRNAAGRGCETRPGYMDKNGAAPAGDPWPGVVVQLDHKIVEVIGPPQTVPSAVGGSNRLIVPAIGRIFAPSVVGSDAAHRQKGAREGPAIGPAPYPQRPKAPPRRAAVPFAFVRPDPRPPQRHDGAQRPSGEPALGPRAGSPCHPDGFQRDRPEGGAGPCNPHGPEYLPCLLALFPPMGLLRTLPPPDRISSPREWPPPAKY